MFAPFYSNARTAQWKQSTAIQIDELQVAEHLAASIRCKTVPLDESGTPDPEAFKQLYQMLSETYPLVHQKLRREVVNGYSLLYIRREPALT